MAPSRKKSTPTSRRRRSGPAPLALGSALTIAQVRPCWRSLRQMLKRGHAEADASELTSIDTAGIQLLLAGGRAAHARGFRLKVHGAHSLLLTAAAGLGLDESLREVLELAP